MSMHTVCISECGGAYEVTLWDWLVWGGVVQKTRLHYWF